MKRFAVLAVLALAACASAPNDEPTQVVSPYGLKYNAVSGNFAAIEPGTPGTGAAE